jgi:hypothetical protein
VKKLLTISVVLAAALCTTTNAFAVIGWAGNAYPNNGYVTVPTGDQFVVAQVWKDGCTNADAMAGCPDITAVLRYQTDLMGATADVAMSYNTDIGNNDEFIGYIPQAALVGAAWVDVTVIFTDNADMPASEFEILGDQNGNPPPLRYTVSPVLPNDVDVTFTVCMSGASTAGDVCVIGSLPEIGSWGTGVTMTNVSGELWEVTVTFLAGDNPSLYYKYKKDGCATWEGTPDRPLTLPIDGTTSVMLPADSWENLPIGCGLGDVLSEDKVVCFQVCMDGVTYTGNTCVIGNQPQLGNWANGVVMTHIGGGLYQACVVFPQGSPMPIQVEYKHQKDDCSTWESVPNRTLTIDNSSAVETTVTSNWDDNPSGMCEPVATDETSWGSVKARF